MAFVDHIECLHLINIPYVHITGLCGEKECLAQQCLHDLDITHCFKELKGRRREEEKREERWREGKEKGGEGGRKGKEEGGGGEKGE